MKSRLPLTLGILASLSLAAYAISGCGIGAPSRSASFVGPGSHYEFETVGNEVTVRHYANYGDAAPTFTVTGTSLSYSTGFKQITVSTVTGTGGPSVGDQVFAIEIPGVALFMKPIASGNEDVIVAVAAGKCPTSNIAANWVKVKNKDTSGSLTDGNTQDDDIFGTFDYNLTAQTAGLGAIWLITNNTISSQQSGHTFAGVTCSNGIMNVDDGNGNALMYLTSVGAAIVNTGTGNQGSFIFGFPRQTVSGAQLGGNYAGVMVMGGRTGDDVMAVRMSVSWNQSSSRLEGTAYLLNDVTTGAAQGEGGELVLNAFNSPGTGFMTGTVTVQGTSSNIVCMGVNNVAGTGKNILNCAGARPDDHSKLFNFLMTSI